MDFLISELILQDETVNVRVNDFIEVSYELWEWDRAIAIEIDTCEDLLGLILSYIDFHHLKGIEKLSAFNFVGLILINCPEQVMNSFLWLI